MTWGDKESLRQNRLLTGRKAQQVPPAEVRESRVSQILRVAEEPPVLESVTIQVRHVTGETVSVHFTTVPGNHPKENKNALTIWPGTIIDWKHPELGNTQLVDNNDSEGTYIMTGLSLSGKDYIVGYSVTGEALGICASAIAKGGADLLLLAPTSVILEIGSLVPGNLQITYRTLRGNKPLTYGNWLALWQGDIDPFDPPYQPQEAQLPPTDLNEGSVIFTSKLSNRSTYTVGYFMSGSDKKISNTSLSAVLRFDTA